jgi:hypothetical protein
MQVHGLAAFGALKDRGGLLHAALEFGFHARFHINLRDFKDHDWISAGGENVKGAAL